MGNMQCHVVELGTTGTTLHSTAVSAQDTFPYYKAGKEKGRLRFYRKLTNFGVLNEVGVKRIHLQIRNPASL